MRSRHGGVGFYRRAGVAGMEGRLRLHHLPALHLRGGSALPHPVGLQPHAAAVSARRAPEEEAQAPGADLVEGDGLGSRGWLNRIQENLPMRGRCFLDVITSEAKRDGLRDHISRAIGSAA